MKRTLSMMMCFVILLLTFLTTVPLGRGQTNDWSEPQQLTTDPAFDHYSSIMQHTT